MWKKFICFSMVLCTLLSCMLGVLAVDETTNDVLYYYEDGYDYSWIYSDQPSGGLTKDDTPWFEKIDGELVFDTEAYVGQAYPIQSAGRPSYARANLSYKIEDTNQYQYLYQMDLKFEKEFANFTYSLRYGSNGWTNGLTKDAELFKVEGNGALKFGGYTQQLELGTMYTIAILVDVRGDTRNKTLFINGEMMSENQSTDVGENPATETNAKTVFLQSMIVRPYTGSGENYSYVDTIITVDNQKLVRVRDLDAMAIEGESTFVIPKGETVVTAQYRADTIFDSGVEAVWSVEPADSGVSIDGNGLLTISSKATAGTYQVTAAQEDKSASIDILLEEMVLGIKGESRIALPSGTYSIMSYSVVDNLGNTYPAEFTLDTPREGIYLEQDGVLRIYGPAQTNLEPITLTAQTEDETFTKTVSLCTGYFEDFSTTGSWGSTTVAEDEDGNRYLNAAGARGDYKISGLENLDIMTMEFRYKVGTTAYNMILGGASGYRDNGTLDDQKWWLTFNAVQSGDGAKVSLKSNNIVVFDGAVPLQEKGWLEVKYVISCANKTMDLYLDGQKVGTEKALDQSMFDYQLKTIINYAAIDDIKVYSGEQLSSEDIKIQILTAANQLKAGAGGQTTVMLKAKVTDTEGKELSGHSLTWSIAGAEEGVTISGNKILINEKAPEEFLLGAEVTTAPDTLAQKAICLVTPDAYIAQDGNVLKVTGQPGDTFFVTVFYPKDTTTMLSAFLAAYDKEDADDENVYFQQTLQADTSGKASLDCSSMKAGLYKVYVKSSEEGVESQLDFYNRLQEVFTTNGVENIMNPGFKTLLLNCTGASEETVETAWNTYQELKNKEAAALLCAEDMHDFYFVCALMELLEEGVYDQKKTAALQQAYPDYDFSGVELLEKNIDFDKVVDAALEKKATNPVQLLADIKEQSILIGLEKLPNVNNAKVFLAALDNAKYNNATATQKTYIAQQIGNRIYDSLDAIHAAIEALSLPTDNTSSGSGGGSGGGSGNSGGGSGGTTSRPVSSGTIYPSNTGTNGGTNQQTQRFSDVGEGHWAYSYIESLAQKSILVGDGGLFRPEDSLTRAEFVKILMMAFQVPLGEEAGFEDVSQEDWFAPYVAGARQAGLVNGTGRQFLPDAAISRQDAVVMAYRFATAAGTSWATAAIDFTDSAQLAEYAKEAVASFVADGIVEGVGGGKFAPEEPVTRAAAAKIVCRLIEGGE